MDFKSLVESRYSVRSYTPQPVSEEALRYVLDCARLAPSAVNFQPWHFYVVTTADMRSRLTACYQREWFVTALLRNHYGSSRRRVGEKSRQQAPWRH